MPRSWREPNDHSAPSTRGPQRRCELTMLVVGAPFACVPPVALAVKTCAAIGFGGASLCTLPADRGVP
jgi:hypothetical protein